MIFVDTNVLIRAYEGPRSDTGDGMSARARDLLRSIGQGVVSATTSEAIIAETIHVLSSRVLYRQSPPQVRDFLAPFIDAPGLRIGPRQVYLRALDIWVKRPGLKFVDALTIAYVEQGDVRLASFDRQLLGSPGVTPYWPESA